MAPAPAPHILSLQAILRSYLERVLLGLQSVNDSFGTNRSAVGSPGPSSALHLQQQRSVLILDADTVRIVSTVMSQRDVLRLGVALVERIDEAAIDDRSRGPSSSSSLSSSSSSSGSSLGSPVSESDGGVEYCRRASSQSANSLEPRAGKSKARDVSTVFRQSSTNGRANASKRAVGALGTAWRKWARVTRDGS